MPATAAEKHELTVKYGPDAGQSGERKWYKIKDTNGDTYFTDDSKLMTVAPGDSIEVLRTPTKRPDTYNIRSFKPPAPDAPKKPVVRARTDPHDSLQMFLGGVMKEWVAAYAQSLSITTTGKMQPVDAATVVQAMNAFATAYTQFHGTRTQSGTDFPPKEDDMQDEINF